MERERMVCLTLAALCAVYGIYQMILLLRHRSHTASWDSPLFFLALYR